MSQDGTLFRWQLDRVRATAAVLLPGSSDAPAANVIPDFDELVQRAAGVLRRRTELDAAIEELPAEPSWETLSSFAERHPSSFELVSLLLVGGYFMSATALASLGLPTGERRPAHFEQVVDELSSGILDPVVQRGSPVRALQDVNRERPSTAATSTEGVRGLLMRGCGS
jgi:hypothetical protein